LLWLAEASATETETDGIDQSGSAQSLGPSHPSEVTAVLK
jgi:hypothetical protein